MSETIIKKRGRKSKIVQTPVQVEAPTQVEAPAPVQAPAQTEEVTEEQAPVQVEAPAEASAIAVQAPAEAEAQAQAPAQVEAQAQTQAQAQAPAQAIAEAPTDPHHKKRGRKPKGGKIILNTYLTDNVQINEPNIILHLKCNQADLIQHNLLSNVTDIGVEAFQFEQNKNIELNYQVISDKTIDALTQYNAANTSTTTAKTSASTATDDIKIIWDKLKELTYQLHTNNISDKKSACFWCTCDFDNPSIFIPKHELNNTYYCYGCFCSPECATAFLFKESIDTSTRFERYHLLNHIYCKIYDYKKNIKPAPDPFYTLNKYYGNLTIQEYRKLLKNERLLLVVDKPLSRTLPELHEDNDDFIYNGKSIPSSNKFKLRRKNKQSKTDILSDTFNLKTNLSP